MSRKYATMQLKSNSTFMMKVELINWNKFFFFFNVVCRTKSSLNILAQTRRTEQFDVIINEKSNTIHSKIHRYH
jgi:hypothetical protein